MSESKPAVAETLRSLLWNEPENPARKALRDYLKHFQEDLGVDRVSVSVNQPSEAGLRMQVLAETGIQVPGMDEASSGQRGVVLQPRVPQPTGSVVCHDITPGSDVSVLDNFLLQAGIRSYAVLPLRLDGEVIGSLNLGSRTPDFFTSAVLARAEKKTQIVATAAHHVALFTWNERQSRLLAMIRELIEGLSPFVRVREASRHLSHVLAEQLETQRVALFVLNEDGSWLTCEAVYEKTREGDGGLLPSVSVTESDFLSGVLHGEPLVLDSRAAVASIPEPARKQLGVAEAESLVIVPLMHGKDPVGIVLAQWATSGPSLPGNAKDTLSFLGQQIGFLLHIRQMAAARERSARSFSGLVSMSHTLSSVSDLSKVPELAARQARDICEADEATLMLLEPDGFTLRPIVCLSEWAEQVLQMRLKVGEGITGTVAARRYRESAGIPGSARSERGAAAETPSGDL